MTIRGRWSERWASALAVACAAVLGVGCKGADSGGQGPTREEQIRSAVKDAGKVTPLGEDKDTVTGTSTVEEGDYENTYEQHDAIANLEGVAYLGLNDDIIWPGSLVTGTHLHQFVYEPITVPRGPITLSVNLESAGGTGQLFKKVDDPKLSTVRQGIQELLGQAITPGTKVPAKVEYREERVSSLSHMSMFVGADVSYGAGSLSTRFDWSSTQWRNHMLAKYTQIYYTVDVDAPMGPEALLALTTTPDQVRAAMPAGSLPVYVASVSYGMMAILCIDTNFSADEMAGALNAAWKGEFSAVINAGYTAQEILETSNLTVIVYGGSTKGLGDVELGLDGFRKVIAADKEFSADTPGVPILYKFRHVLDNTLAMTSLTSQYTVVRPVQLRQRVEVVVDKFRCIWASDASGAIDVYNLWVRLNAYQTLGGTEVRVGTADMPVYQWPGGTMGMNAGTELGAGSSVILTFDTVLGDYALARLELRGYAVEDDVWPNPDDEGWGYLPLASSQFNFGTQRTMSILAPDDFRIDSYITLRDATR